MDCVAALPAAGADDRVLDTAGHTVWDVSGIMVRALLQRPPASE